MAICDPDEGMHKRFAGILPEQIIADLPRDEDAMAALDVLIAQHADKLAGIIVEPLVQGAGGMIFHDAIVLSRLRALADKYDLLLIFDEIFTGLWPHRHDVRLRICGCRAGHHLPVEGPDRGHHAARRDNRTAKNL